MAPRTRQFDRIVWNSAATFSRMALTFGLGLWTTRILLRSLGPEGFGSYAVILAVTAVVTVFSDSMLTTATSRLAIEVGRLDEVRLRQVFSTALAVSAAVAVGSMTLAAAAASWIVGWLSIHGPFERDAVLSFVLLAAANALLAPQMPFRAILQAQQAIVWISVFEGVESLTRFAVACLVSLSTASDRLLVLAALSTAAAAGHTALIAVLSLRAVPAARPSAADFRVEQLGRLGRFGFWDLVANAGWKIRIAGAQLLLNLVFGPIANAAYSLATQLAMLANNVAFALYRAVQPALIAAEARGDRSTVRRLVSVCGKYMFLAMSAILVVLVIEPTAALQAWLGGSRVPAGAPILVSFTALGIGVSWLSVGGEMVVQAGEDYRGYALMVVAAEIGTLILAAAWIGFGSAGPWAVPVAGLLAAVLFGIARVRYAGGRIGLGIIEWSRAAVGPAVVVAGTAGSLAYVASRAITVAEWRWMVLLVVYGVLAPILTWFLGMREWERSRFRTFLAAASRRISGLKESHAA